LFRDDEIGASEWSKAMTATRELSLAKRDRAMALLLRPLLSALASRNRLAILIYHRVLDEPDPLQPTEIDRCTFDLNMEMLRRVAKPMRLTDAVALQRRGSLPSGAVCVTFDDGYADNLSNALPVLQKWNIPATIFVTESVLDGGIMWSDAVIESVRSLPDGEHDFSHLSVTKRNIAGNASRARLVEDLQGALKYLEPEQRATEVHNLQLHARAKLPSDLMLKRSDVARLREGGFEIGAHTLTHPILARIPDELAYREIAESKHRLESFSGTVVQAFAYPNGRPGKDYHRRHVAMVKDAGFGYAVSTAPGIARPSHDVLQLPRLGFGPVSPANLAVRLIAAYTDPPAVES
jgi:peptidoglycan/xylan/chitin deacetylase (PgdA/CDA1 family)